MQRLPKPTSRPKKTLWLWVAAGTDHNIDIDLCWRAYGNCRRHGGTFGSILVA